VTTCSRCKLEISPNVMQCPHCGWPGLYPNVVQAELERTEWQDRHQQALGACAADLDPVARRFENTVGDSHAVMCVKASEAHRIVFADNELKATYYATADTRFPRAQPPEGTDWNAIRELVDSALFTDAVKPHIRFAALALTFDGLTAYGPCTLVCETSMIEHRASTFEKNSCQFFIERGGISFATGKVDVPPGYRSTWADRGKLCAAKLAGRFEREMDDDDFAKLLMTPGTTTADDEYVEVHICGPVSLRTLKGVAIDEHAPAAIGQRGILADLRDRLEDQHLLLPTRP
jgi:hypothetical protein